MSLAWIYDAMKRGDIPRPVSLGSKCVRWLVADVKEWEASRAAADPDEAKVGNQAVKGARLMAMPTAGRRRTSQLSHCDMFIFLNVYPFFPT